MTVVIGYGTPDRGDDCAGLLVVRGLRNVAARCVEVIADGLELMEAWTGAERAIIVDAVVSGAAPGSIHRWNGRDLPRMVIHPVSSHGFGLGEAITLANQLDLLPRQLEVIGIEAGHFDYGRDISQEVAQAARGVARELTLELACT